MLKLYKADVNASGGWTRTYGVMAKDEEQALQLINSGNATYFTDDLLDADCVYEDGVVIDDVEEGDESEFERAPKNAPQSTWDTLRKFKDKWYCPRVIKNAINEIEYI